MEPQWTPTFEELARNVQSALRSDSHDLVYSVLRELDFHKAAIHAVLEAPGTNAAHRAQLKLGSPVIGGKVRTVNEQFIADAILLSDQLDMDEYAAASLLQHGLQHQARFDRSAVETAILLFHRERIASLIAIYALLDTSTTFESPTEFSKAIVPFRNELLDPAKGNLASKALALIESLEKKATTLKSSMSETSALVAQLGMSINEDRLDYLKQERALVATILFAIAFYHELSSAVVKSTISALKKLTLSDPIATYLTVTVMAAFEVSAEHQRLRGKDDESFPDYIVNESFITEYAPFITETNWAVPAIRNSVLYQFSLCIGNTLNKRSDGMTEDDLQIVMEKAVASDAFQLIANYVLGFKSQVVISGEQFEVPFDIPNASLGITDQNTDGFDTTVGKPVVVPLDSSMQDGILAMLELSIKDFIISMLPLLRKIKHKEEDAAVHQTSLRQSQSHSVAKPRNDLEALFTVIALVYKDRPEAGLRFWPNNDDRLYRFLKWGVDCKNTARAFFEMLGSLAAGSQCANAAYEFLKSNGGRYGTQSTAAVTSLCSWSKLFEAIEFYTNRLNADQAAGRQLEKIRPEEEALLKSFLRLLSTVAQYSAVARVAMNDSKQFQVIHVLFRFLICPIAVDLKANVLDAIAAFAAPTGAANDAASLVWEYLEQARILPKAYSASLPEQLVQAGDKTASAASARQEHENLDSGIGFDIEEIEAANETYPETIAFARLLSSLVQVPLNPEELLSGGSPTIPSGLGSNYRQPGVIPYVRFVLNVIFVKAFNRSYRVASEKWKVLDACLNFMERCLLSFDIGSFILGDSLRKEQDSTAVDAQRNSAVRASLHPAFEILIRLLSGGDVLRTIFQVVGTGVDVLNKDEQSIPHLKSSITRCFRILTKTMQLQDVFMEYIVQVLLATTTRSSVLSSLAPMEQHLAYSHTTIVDIACYINCEVNNEICSLAIEILDHLSASPLFTSGESHRGVVTNRLVRLLESSPRSNQILYGFVQKLETEDDELTTEFGASQAYSSMAIDEPETRRTSQKNAVLVAPAITGSTIRLQIMRLLLDNLDENRGTPSIAHFLLGYPTVSKITGPERGDTLSTLTSVTCLHVTLDLLRRGMDVQGLDINTASATPLCVTHPQLAEKCQHLVYKLCSVPETTSPTMRYLRTREAFFYRHLRALPTRFEEGLAGNHGIFTRVDGSHFRANFFHLLFQLYQRSWVMRTSALELRAACDTRQRREAESLLSLLYSNTDNARTTNGDEFMYSLSRASNGNLVQPRMKILELLDSLDFSWEDDLVVRDLDQRHFFAEISEETCLEKDEYGVEMYNVRKIFSLLMARKAQLESENAISASDRRTIAHAEMEAIMEQCLARNHARKIEAGRRTTFEAWRELVEITLGPGFDFLKVEQREVMLLDVLEAVLAKLQGDCPADIAAILSKVALCVLQRLRSDHFCQFIFQATSTDPNEINARLPAERLHRVAQDIIACILRPSTSRSRCNLYSTLVNYFQYTRSEGDTVRSTRSSGQSVNGHIASGATSQEDHDVRVALELGNQVLVAEAGDRLFEVICKDASDVDEVCKISAFTLLNTLYGLFEKEKTNRVLMHLVQRNYLKHFIEVMAREDLELQASVKGRMSRVPIVSETRLTLFLRIAQRRDGAEQLLEYGYFDVLTNSSTVIDMRSNLDSTDYGPFEQTEGSRYHNIVYPMLQAAVAILASLGRNHRTATRKAEAFVTSHQDTITSILRDNDFPTTISSLRELRVVTAFLNQLAGHIASQSTSAASVFGSLHGLLLALIPKYSSADQWAQSLRPVTDAELVMQSTLAPSLTARKGMTLFERDARGLSRDICKNLLSYCQTSTDIVDRSAAKSFTPLFTWMLSNVKTGHELPSLSTLASYLGRTANEVQEGLQRRQTQLLKLKHISSLTPEEKQDILMASDEDFVDDLIAIQRDQLAVQVLQKMLMTATQEVLSSLYLLETTLVLFWRHLDYYLGQYPGQLDGPGAQAGQGSSRFGFSVGLSSFGGGNGTLSLGAGAGAGAGANSFGGSGANANLNVSQSPLSKNFKPTLEDAKAMKRDAGHLIKPVLDSIQGLDLAQERVGWDNSARNSFIELLTQRIRALVERN
ncbi:hypothetical protein BGZ67_003013 [Mortierella alpina]|nr:hypothetical protein BGZ67_003013 [Mortierella alpina]